MDSSTVGLITALGLAIIGNIAAWWQLANQRAKDKKDDLQKLIDDQRGEIDRLRTRGTELEDKLVAKINENGELKLAAIDKDIELKSIKYKLQDTETRLAVYTAKPSPRPTPYKGKAKREKLKSAARPSLVLTPQEEDILMEAAEEPLMETGEESSDISLLDTETDDMKQAILQVISAEVEEVENNSIRDIQ